jgi:hypothetical protein
MNGIVPLAMLALVALVFTFLGSVAQEMISLRRSHRDNARKAHVRREGEPAAPPTEHPLDEEQLPLEHMEPYAAAGGRR